MISVKERLAVSTVTSAVFFVIAGMIMIGTGFNTMYMVLGFAIGSYGYQAIAHTLAVRKRERLRKRFPDVA